MSDQSLHDAALATLERVARERGTSLTSVGVAISVHAGSLSRRSAWLDDTGKPHLYLDLRATNGSGPPHVLQSIASLDPSASSRVYAGAQFVLPEFGTCVTFLVRVFRAAGSVAVDLRVLTLGPPGLSWQYIRDRLQTVANEETRLVKAGNATETTISRPLTNHLHNQRMARQRDTFKSTMQLGAVLDALAKVKDDLASAHTEAELLAEESTTWIGPHTAVANWREAHSLTMTHAYFGGLECKACVRSLYDCISKSILTTLEELGFDISDYRDEKGTWNIKADKIEQMVVGERINITANAKEHEGAQREAAAPPAQAAA